jgi:heme O synthase-like polyprenyltransferase
LPSGHGPALDTGYRSACRRPKHAIGLFGFSIAYLFALYLFLTLDALVAALRG